MRMYECVPRAGLTPLLVPMTIWASELPAFTAAESYSYLMKDFGGRGENGLDRRECE